MTFINKTV